MNKNTEINVMKIVIGKLLAMTFDAIEDSDEVNKNIWYTIIVPTIFTFVIDRRIICESDVQETHIVSNVQISVLKTAP